MTTRSIRSVLGFLRRPVRVALLGLVLVAGSLTVYAVVTDRNPLCFPMTANGLLVAMSVENLTRASETIVMGTVQQVGPSWQSLGGMVYTEVTVVASDFIKNLSSDATVRLRILGGTTICGGVGVEDQPSFEKDENVLLFLHHSTFESKEPYLAVVGGPQGKYTIVDTTAYWGDPNNSRPLDDLIAEIRKYL